MIALIAGLGAGCSSAYSRNSLGLFAGTGATEEAPGNVDGTTTASIGGLRHPVPTGEVTGAAGAYDPYAQQAATAEQTAQPLGAVSRSELPPAGQSASALGAAEESSAIRSQGNGWGTGGGTQVTLREGETLYNLSRRYGIPVPAIVKANGLADASQVRAGQSIIIPTYSYSSNAPVSAPDSHPGTRFASASTGSTVAPGASDVPQPTWRPTRTISLSRNNTAPAPAPSQVASNPDRPALAPRNASVDPTVTASSLPEPRNVGSAAGSAARQASTSAPESTGIDQFRWPVRGRVISAYGEKTGSGRNDGIDISVPEGTAVKAVENGVVVYSGDELEGFGNLLLVRHSDGWVSAYAHNKSLEVGRGDEVRRGQIIARSGRTGNAEMPKLHFELRKDSAPVDPLKHLGGA